MKEMRVNSSMRIVSLGAALGLLACGDSAETKPAGDSCELTDPVCTAGDANCLASFDNTALDTYLLRVAEFDITQPQAFTDPVLSALIKNYVIPTQPECFLEGYGGLTWLIEVSSTTGTVRTGGGYIEGDDLRNGVCFLQGSLTGSDGNDFATGPITIEGGVSGDALVASSTEGPTVALFLAADRQTYILLPFEHVRFSGATISAGQNCIGTRNEEGLEPDTGCQPQGAAFTGRGLIEASISLEVADGIEVPDLNETLCVLLTGDRVRYGTDESPQRCKRNGDDTIEFQGDWCSATDAAADGDCKDAVKFVASFAANGVKAASGCQ